MIANISPGLTCSEHTLNTLRYADRVKELKKEKSSNDKFDKEEEFSNMMMMPRQHNKTVKYIVDKKALNQLANTNIGGVKHINSILNSKNKSQYYPGVANKNNNLNINKKQLNTNYNNFNLDFDDNTKLISLEDKMYYSKYNDIDIFSDEDYQKLNNEHENLIEEILKDEEKLICSHKEHIDDTVDIVKNVRIRNSSYYL